MTAPQPIIIDRLHFLFADGVRVERYETWEHYRQVWNRHGGQKAVDALALEPSTAFWLIEAKDFRVITQPPRPAQVRDLPQTIEAKIRDTLAGLGDAAVRATTPSEQTFAKDALARSNRRIVVHLEPHPVGGPGASLFPQGFRAGLVQRLRQLLRDIDRHVLVLSIATTPRAGVPWTVC